MQVKKLALGHSGTWIACGWQLFFRSPALWLAMAAIYVALALLLMQMPFIGPLLLVLLTPVLAAGALMAGRRLESEVIASRPRGASLADRARAVFARALSQLLAVFSEPDKTLSVMVIATLTLGAVVVVQILTQLLHVNTTAWPAMVGGGVEASIWLPWLLRLLFITAIKLVLALVMLYAVHQVVIDQQTPLAALENSVNAGTANALPLTGIALLLVLPVVVATGLGGLPFAVIGSLMLPLLITTLYCSCKDMYH